MIKLEIEPLHPKKFRELHNCSVYQMHRLSGYPVDTLKNWLADATSTRCKAPKEYVLHHFGTIHKLLQGS
ncbi:hypothetical protein G7B40_040425 [Aetokthonos hydrillicola Thurmond2011]|jgi:hypothetical protein|uniref:Uncharacterized protein n=1 Tax=Aetokthonos hydrillicola Thurmond2011 TaxID=2712845 RepID=A0AAP5MCX3_9CYAN|nr:hypothetical protein [Aetokthonos hydrillicola]MBO3463683.1 hypothetical protein [Aetokthonos hydrillicola CCALA 1050]MDR9900755.1 hypothetical protein [Aetokthonos hydrillicola Thurmond2011]